jgi:hypothetical protein
MRTQVRGFAASRREVRVNERAGRTRLAYIFGMKAAIAGALALVAAASHPAAACGVPDFGAYLVAVAESLDPKSKPISTPLLVIGGGFTSEGGMPSVNVGYGWGEKDQGGLFPGSSITRVLAGIRSNGTNTVTSLTYGWYTNGLGSLGFDVGAEAQLSGTQSIGPMTRLTVGSGGIALRFTGGAQFGGDEPRLAGAAEVVLELMDIAKTL